MKSFRTLLGAALVMAGFTACNDNNELTELIEAPQTGLQPMTFTVRAGGEEGTRSHLVNGASVMFDAGDAISVFDDEGTEHNRKFTTTAGGSVASFTGEAGTASTYYFLSPYQDDAEVIWGDEIKATVPAVQTAVAGSYDPAAMISVGSGTSTDPTALHNVCALIKFSVAAGLSNISEVTLFSTGSISGSAYFAADGRFDCYGSDYKQVSLKGTLTAGGTYYICVLPGNLDKITVNYVTTTGEVKERKAVNPLTAVAGKIYDFGEIDGSVYTPSTTTPLTLMPSLAKSEATSIQIETGYTGALPTAEVTGVSRKLGGIGNNTIWEVYDTSTKTLSIRTKASTIVMPGSINDMFKNYTSVTTITGLDKFDMSGVVSMWNMFESCCALQSVSGLEAWSISQVRRMSGMFSGCRSLTSLNLSGWNTEQVTYMHNMFSDCQSLTSLNLSGWNTAKVTNMQNMFSGCEKLASLTLSNNFKVPSGKDENDEDKYQHQGMFNDTGKTAEDGDGHRCKCVVYGVTDSGIINAIKLEGEIEGENRVVSGWNDSRMKFGDVAAWTNRMTLGQTTATSITIETEATFSGYSEDATHQKLNDGGTLWAVLDGTALKIQTSADKILGPNSFLCTNSIGNQYYAGLFFGYGQVQTIDGLNKLDMSDVTDMSTMFYGCSALQSLTLPDWDTSNVTSMFQMFAGCSTLPSLTLPDWDTSKVRDMSQMFAGCSALPSLTLPVWDTSNVTDMSNMFSGCTALENLTLPNWATSNVTNMSCMFAGCSALQSLTFPNWDTSNVTNMSYMFYECTALENLYLQYLDTQNVTDMSDMFWLCHELKTIVLSDKFVFKSGVYYQGMFYECGLHRVNNYDKKGVIYGATNDLKDALNDSNGAGFYADFDYMRFADEGETPE
mgnify:CR=1 FL=1